MYNGFNNLRFRIFNPEAEVLLFGSQARSESKYDSDWDILILLNLPTASRSIEKEYKDVLYDIKLETGQPISTSVFSKLD